MWIYNVNITFDIIDASKVSNNVQIPNLLFDQPKYIRLDSEWLG